MEDGLTAGKDADDEPGTSAARRHGPAPVGMGIIPGEALAVAPAGPPQARGHLAPQHQVVGYQDTRQDYPAPLTKYTSATEPHPSAANDAMTPTAAARQQRQPRRS